jgi:hypothetical protein
MKIKTIILPVVGLLGIYAGFVAVAKDATPNLSQNPLGCKDVGYKFEFNALTILPESVGERQSLYFVFNKLNKPIKLYQMVHDNSSIKTSLDHTISPSQWAVLATSEKELKYICTVEQNASRYGNVINCGDSLKICEYTKVKFGLNNRGNFWVVNSNTRGGAVGDVVRYGIIPQ